MKLLRKFAALFRKEKLDADMAAELRAHLELQAAENEKRGMSPDEARLAARRAFGGVEQIKERCRDERTRGFVWLEQALQDLRYAARSLRRSPGFTTVVVLTLALGIGANTTIFSVVHAVLLQPLPFTEPDRLVSLRETRPEAGSTGRRTDVPVSPATFFDYRRDVGSFAQVAALSGSDLVHIGQGEPEQLSGAFVTANFFSTLGVVPQLGRDFRTEEGQPGAEGVALLSDGMWRRRFGGDEAVIGRVITLDGRPFTIIGVLPPTLDGTALGLTRLPPQIWVPLALGEAGAERGVPALGMHARLKPGATLAAAQAEVDAVMKRLAIEFPATNATRGGLVQPLAERAIGDVRATLWLVFAAVVLVQLIACANIANLLLARASRRGAESAMRAALGATRSRLIRQFLTESLLLAVSGCVIGLLAAILGASAFVAALPDNLPGIERVAINGPVLAFTVGVALLTGLFFGLAPAWQGAKADLQATLQTAGRSGQGGGAGHRLRAGLVVAQVALSLMLLAGAGLVVRSFIALSGVDPGFDPRHVLTLRINLAGDTYRPAAKRTAFFEQLLPQVQALPGVEAAATVYPLPFSPSILNRPFTLPGQPVDPKNPLAAQFNIVSSDYFRALSIRLTQGRAFNERDREGAPLVAIVNESTARRIWPGENPIGKRISTGMGAPTEREVVGVFADIRQRQLDGDQRLQICVPSAQEPWRSAYLAVRTSGTAAPLAAIRQRVAALDPNLPITDVVAFRERVTDSIAQRRFATGLLGAFAGIALLLAVLGIYGVMSYLVTQRTREFGIRMALGAKAGDLLQMVVRQGMRLVLIGLALGVIGSLALSRVLTGFLFGVRATDPMTFVVVSVLLAIVGGLACWLPARRAAKVDPMMALRSE
jgi:predicted permease